MAKGERKSTNVRVVRWKVALLRREGQVFDKEKDTIGAKSIAHVLSSGPA